MGLFSQQPEHNEDWAGLPSEPLRPQSDAERLAESPPVDAAGLGMSGFGAEIIEIAVTDPAADSVEIADVPVVETATPDEADETGSNQR